MKTITYNSKTLEISDKDLEELEQKYKQPKAGFKHGDEYYNVGTFGTIDNHCWKNDEYDHQALGIGNAFHTGEEAKAHKDWLIARATIIKRIKELNDGWTPDWKDEEQKKYMVYYDHTVPSCEVMSRYVYQYQPNNLCLKSEELAMQLIEELPAELKLYLNIEE